MLGYLDEPNTQRVMRLAEAIQADLASSAQKNGPRWPVAAVITQGPVRRVDVPGQSWNFEGPAVIAAARILTKLKSGQLAVEQAARSSETMRWLRDPETLAGKHAGESFVVRVHSRIKFQFRNQRVSKLRGPQYQLTRR